MKKLTLNWYKYKYYGILPFELSYKRYVRDIAYTSLLLFEWEILSGILNELAVCFTDDHYVKFTNALTGQ